MFIAQFSPCKNVTCTQALGYSSGRCADELICSSYGLYSLAPRLGTWSYFSTVTRKEIGLYIKRYQSYPRNTRDEVFRYKQEHD